MLGRLLDKEGRRLSSVILYDSTPALDWSEALDQPVSVIERSDLVYEAVRHVFNLIMPQIVRMKVKTGSLYGKQ
jgi:hypothetical protein